MYVYGVLLVFYFVINKRNLLFTFEHRRSVHSELGGPGPPVLLWKLKALSHWQFFVLHVRATLLINTFLLSNIIAQRCDQYWRIEQHYCTNVQSLHASIAQLCDHYWLILAIQLSNTFPREQYENNRTTSFAQ